MYYEFAEANKWRKIQFMIKSMMADGAEIVNCYRESLRLSYAVHNFAQI